MRKAFVAIAALALLAGACSSSEEKAQGSADVLRLGIFPNLTHAPGYIALEEDLFEETMPGVDVQVTYFNSGSDAGAAILSGSIDATYIGPGPATALYLQSDGGVAIVSGVTSGGASFVVRRGAGISSSEDLIGKKIAVPGFGNTQDVALRTWLHEQGLEANDAGGEVDVLEVDNPELLGLFEAGHLDGAWEPEPYPSLLLDAGVADLFVNEADLWPDGEFTTTVLLVNTTFMDAQPELVEGLVEANVMAIEEVEADPASAKAAAQAGLIEAGAPSLDQAVVDEAWSKLTFTFDPVAPSLAQGAANAYALGFLEEQPTDLSALFRLDVLNKVLGDLQLPVIEVAV
ncbi:MAG TPA: ABC transporter substrate-binding protein [Actinomycetota bacterium]|jgi:NitT/TauT family transport system substrate-binding protein